MEKETMYHHQPTNGSSTEPTTTVVNQPIHHHIFTVYANIPQLSRDILKSNSNPVHTQPSIIHVPSIVNPYTLLECAASDSDSSTTSSTSRNSTRGSSSREDEGDSATSDASSSSSPSSSCGSSHADHRSSSAEGLPSCTHPIHKKSAPKLKLPVVPKLDPGDNEFISDLVNQLTDRVRVENHQLQLPKKRAPKKLPIDSSSTKKLQHEWYDSDDSFIDDSGAFTNNLDLMMPSIPGWFMNVGHVLVKPRVGVSEISTSVLVPPQLTKSSASSSTSSFVSTTKLPSVPPQKPLPTKPPNPSTITCIRKKYLRMPDDHSSVPSLDSVDQILQYAPAELIHPSIVQMVRDFQALAEMTDWSNKGQFPDHLKAPMWELTLAYLNMHRRPPSELFVMAVFYTMPYNMFTIRKYIATRLVSRYMSVLRNEIDSMIRDLRGLTKDLPTPCDLNPSPEPNSAASGSKRPTQRKGIKLSGPIKQQLTKITRNCILIEMLENWVEIAKQKWDHSQVLLDRMAIVKDIFVKVDPCFPPEFLKARDISLLTVWEQYAMTDDDDNVPHTKKLNNHPSPNKGSGVPSPNVLKKKPSGAGGDKLQDGARGDPSNVSDTQSTRLGSSRVLEKKNTNGVQTSPALDHLKINPSANDAMRTNDRGQADRKQVRNTEPASPGDLLPTTNDHKKHAPRTPLCLSPHTPEANEPDYQPSSPIVAEQYLPLTTSMCPLEGLALKSPIKRTADDMQIDPTKRVRSANSSTSPDFPPASPEAPFVSLP